MLEVAAVLAGGRARRMGGENKALLEVDGRAALDRQLDVLRPRFARIAVVLTAGASERDAAPYRARQLEVIEDRLSGRGPLAGLAVALEWAAGASAARVFALACDMPYLNGAVVDLVLLRARDRSADLAVPVIGGRPEPLCACYGANLVDLVERELAGGRLALAALGAAARAAGLRVEELAEAELRTLDPNLLSLTNLNRPSDRL
jgi:molybdopterin-guanine dinucleotide biosynthesis protein A